MTPEVRARGPRTLLRGPRAPDLLADGKRDDALVLGVSRQEWEAPRKEPA